MNKVSVTSFPLFILAFIFGLVIHASMMTVFAGCDPATPGDDTINCTAPLGGDVEGDAGNDVIYIDNTVNAPANDVGGDLLAAVAVSGDDTITNDGIIEELTGDSLGFDGSGNDTLINNNVVDRLYGDANSGNGSGDDTIINNGTITNGLTADAAWGSGSGNDTVINNGFTAGILGDSWNTTGSGTDTLTNNGTTNIFSGDSQNGDGVGNDVITNNSGATAGNIYGDTIGGTTATGNDTINNHGYVSGSIYGDDAAGNGTGSDTIYNTGTVNAAIYAGNGNNTVTNSGVVGGDVNTGAGSDTITNTGDIQDDMFTGAGGDTIDNSGMVDNIYAEGGNDTITNTGHINNDINAGDGADSITHSGSVDGNIVAGTGNDGVTLQNNAVVDGTIDGGANYDILTFEFSSTDSNALDKLAADIAAQNPSGGTVTYNGNTYTWTNFEELKQLLTHLGIAGNSVPFQGFCSHQKWSAFDVYVIDASGNGQYAFSVSVGRLIWGLRISREEERVVWLNAGLEAAMFALPDGKLMIVYPGYEFIFEYEAMCGPLPNEPEDPVEEPEEEVVESLPYRTIINRPR